MKEYRHPRDLPKSLTGIFHWLEDLDDLRPGENFIDAIGGFVYVVESQEDFDEAVKEVFDTEDEDWDGDYTTDVMEFSENGVELCRCTNNAGGNVYWIPNDTLEATVENLEILDPEYEQDQFWKEDVAP
jgi:hypothetical protein